MSRVCVCVRIHTPTPSYIPTALKIEKTQTTPLSFRLSKITPHSKQQVPSYTSWTPPSLFPSSERKTCTYMSAYAHPVASVCANVYADVHNTCLTYWSAHAWCSQHLLKCVHTLRKMHMHSCMRAYATVQKLLCYGSYCELVLSLARASCRLSFAARPAYCLDEIRRPTLFAQEIRSNPR